MHAFGRQLATVHPKSSQSTRDQNTDRAAMGKGVEPALANYQSKIEKFSIDKFMSND